MSLRLVDLFVVYCLPPGAVDLLSALSVVSPGHDGHSFLPRMFIIMKLHYILYMYHMIGYTSSSNVDSNSGKFNQHYPFSRK